MGASSNAQILVLINFIFILLTKNGFCALPQYKWMYHLPYGSTVNLEPLFNNTRCLNQSQCYWLLPDRNTRLNYPLDGSTTSKYSISSQGILTIVNIQSVDDGIYHFFQRNHSEWIVSKSLLNIHGAPFDSIWLEYWPNVVGGLVASASVLIGMSLILLADKYRYRSPAAPTTRHPVESANPVFINDDTDTLTSQKRALSRRSSSTSNTTNLRVEKL